ncbi:MAG: class I SAM-dependent methyltransferase [Halieaceae bacterium]|jgi:SAM-dependent methyltransferase|nr:class I SAM-dependent methyltransferase [Halieaceae bacterium]
MHSKKGSILKRWHSLTASPRRFREKWAGGYRTLESPGVYQVRCRDCRSFDPGKQRCSINFGTPLRKCVVSSIEAHFHDCAGKRVLEIGFGRFMLARNLIRRSGGTWTGIEPRIDRSTPAQIGRGCHGTAADIPFADETFDMAFGIQSIEHWGQKVYGGTPSDYRDCLREVHRVLKPGGSVYFDAPVYFHGHEMFIMGDLPRIRDQFSSTLWENVSIEKWREDFAPLEAYPPSATVLNGDWPAEIESYSDAQVEAARTNASVYLLAITATKKAA